MNLSTCGDPDCPNKRRVEELEHDLGVQRRLLEADSKDRRHLEKRIEDLERELRVVYRLLDERAADSRRCSHCPKGERCALPAGHEGGCKWANGD